MLVNINNTIGLNYVPQNDPYFSNVSLLMHMDGANNSTNILDSSINSLVPTVGGNAKIVTSESKFGGSSLSLANPPDHLSFSNTSPFEFGTDLFTIDAWIKCGQTKSYGHILGQNQNQFGPGGNPNSGSFSLRVNTPGGINGFDGVPNFIIRTSTFVFVPVCSYNANLNLLNDFNWHFIRVVRDSPTSLKMAADGNIVGSINNFDSNQIIGYPSWPVTVGVPTTHFYNNDGFSNTFIDELRVTKGVARNINEVPTSAFLNS